MRRSASLSLPRSFWRIAGIGTLLLTLCSPILAQRKSVAPSATYEKDILPIFRARCLGCHGQGQTRAGLDLRTLGKALQGGFSGAAVLPGAPAKSPLYQQIASGKMPPGGAKLSPQELQQIERWIRAGAKGTTAHLSHWAFRPPTRAAIPKPKASQRVRNPIDAFLLDSLERKNLTFAPDAEKRVLLRRVAYDLLGLPPTPQELDAFLADKSPTAYEKVVERLLASPHYGERWARHWLDTAGYADSEGVLQEDRLRPNAWRYRDYVVRSFNADKPYDLFLREQIAGDELTDYRNAPQWNPQIEEKITATGFLRTAVDATRDDFNTHQFTEYQYRMLNDTQTILVSTTLGLTLHCARCHNHKYEPLTQKDYYRVQAILEGAIRPKGKLLPTSRRQIVAGTLAEQKRAADINAQADAALQEFAKKQTALFAEFHLKSVQDGLNSVAEPDRKPLLQAFTTEEAKRAPEQKTLLEKYKTLTQTTPEALEKVYPDYKEKRKPLLEAEAKERGRRIALAEIRALYDQDAAPPPTHLFLRGEWTRPGEAVEPGVPTILEERAQPFRVPLPPKEAISTGRRRAFAEWLTRPTNPLTARVIVNRLWSHHFGVGLVASLDNFGVSGAEPTHPALLDWLTCETMRGIGGSAPWSLKALHRLIVTSSAYRQSSRSRPDGSGADPTNRLLWRQNVSRLEAEAIRDGILAVSGRLDPTLYGEPIAQEIRGTGEVAVVQEETQGRRSLYLLVRRSLPVSFLQAFDAPIMETNCTRRTTSTTATQALALLNSSFMATQANHFAQRLLKAHPMSQPDAEAGLLHEAYRLAFSRPPAPSEAVRLRAFLRDQQALYLRGGKPAPDAYALAVADLCHALFSANEFVYLD